MIEDFNFEEIINIIQSSHTYKETLLKLGYKGYSAQNHIIKNFCEKNNIDLSHFTHSTLKDLTGMQFNRLTVLERDLSKPRGHQEKTYWICKCDCGNIVSVTSQCLIKKETQSCGCLQKERTSQSNKLNLIGQRFGKLIAIDAAPNIKEDPGQDRTTWNCLCDCGKVVNVKTINLRSGDAQSCGCTRSHGETKIEQFLNNNFIKYKREYSFNDLKDKRKLRFDFAIFDKSNELKFLIEYQGKQHYYKGFYETDEKELLERQRRDALKKQYCEDNNIKLIIISFKDYDKINEILEGKLCTDI